MLFTILLSNSLLQCFTCKSNILFGDNYMEMKNYYEITKYKINKSTHKGVTVALPNTAMRQKLKTT